MPSFPTILLYRNYIHYTMYKINKIHCIRLCILPMEFIHCTMYNKTIAKDNTDKATGREVNHESFYHKGI